MAARRYEPKNIVLNTQQSLANINKSTTKEAACALASPAPLEILSQESRTCRFFITCSCPVPQVKTLSVTEAPQLLTVGSIQANAAD